MSKRNSDGDVLFNKVNVALAKRQRLLASWMQPTSEEELKNLSVNGQAVDEDLNEGAVDDEKLGLGSILPKDVADGSFTRRAPTSNDKLLEQLIGKKAAKAHLAKKEASKSKVKQEKSRRPAPAPKKEESEDEEEGRASAFKSKKRKVEKPKPAAVDVGEESDDLAKVPDADLPLQPANNVKSHEHGAGGEAATKLDLGVREDDSTTEEKAPRQRSSKPKTGSYLDEILAERSKKKKKKKRNKQKDDA